MEKVVNFNPSARLLETKDAILNVKKFNKQEAFAGAVAFLNSCEYVINLVDDFIYAMVNSASISPTYKADMITDVCEDLTDRFEMLKELRQYFNDKLVANYENRFFNRTCDRIEDVFEEFKKCNKQIFQMIDLIYAR